MADLGQELVEAGMGRLDQFQEPLLELLEARLVLLMAAGEMGRDIGIGDLVLRAGDDADPGLARRLDGGEEDHIVDADHIGLDAVEMGRQPLMGDDGAVDDRLPDRHHVSRKLADRREPEMGQMAGDEIGPELRHLLVREPAGHVDEILLEAVFLEHALEAAVADEDRVVAALAQLLGDADAIQRRAEGGLGIKHDGLRFGFGAGHGLPLTIPPAKVAWGQASGQALSPLGCFCSELTANFVSFAGRPGPRPCFCRESTGTVSHSASQCIRKLRNIQV